MCTGFAKYPSTLPQRELGVFVEGGIEEALVGGEDDDEGEWSSVNGLRRDSSLRDPAHKKRAQEKTGSLRSE